MNSCATGTAPAKECRVWRSVGDHFTMDARVPPDVTAELTQILSNLVLGDNEIRSKYATAPSHFILSHIIPTSPSSAEAVVDERLAHRPDVYLLALTQFATRADTVEVVGRQCPSLSPCPLSSP